MAEQDDKSPRKPRPSLTKKQLTTEEGLELLELCQTITEDGSISDEEVGALSKWLEENRFADLPAITLLTTTIEQIIADGIITPEERAELYKAIEIVLPPDVRKDVISKRRAIEKEEREAEKKEREEAKERTKEERERNRPIAGFDFMVAGVRYEGREEVISTFAAQGDDVLFMRERDNKYSRNATLIRLPNGMGIGYVPEEYASDMAPLLDGGNKYSASIKKILSRGQYPIPVIIANFYQPEANANGIKTEVQGLLSITPPKIAEKPQHRETISGPTPTGKKSGIGFSVFAVAGIIVIILWIVLRFLIGG